MIIGVWSFSLVVGPGCWFLVLQFGSGSKLIVENVLLSRYQLHNPLVWCSRLWVVHSSVCETKSLLFVFSGKRGRPAARRTNLVTSGTSL